MAAKLARRGRISLRLPRVKGLSSDLVLIAVVVGNHESNRIFQSKSLEIYSRGLP